MATSRGPLNERHVADALRTLANEHAREREPFDKRRAWQRIEQLSSRAPSSIWEMARWQLSLAAVAITTLALAGTAYLRATAPLRYEARGAVWVGGNLSTEGAPAELEFSDESRISVSPHSTFSVDIVGKHAALTRLAQGQLHVRVHHDPDTNWHFFAGRYEVQVVGTEFDLAWDDKSESLTLRMLSGQVRVLGAPGPARVVKTGGTLHLPESSPLVSTPSASAPVDHAASVVAVGSAPQSARAALDRLAPGKLVEAPASARGDAPDAARLDWNALLKAGQFTTVVQSAESFGIERALQSATADNLKALAQAARYTGHASLSLRAWQALRARFASLPLGAQASFFLGRIYEEQGDTANALRWLGTYVSEAPSGVYASEALGRKLLLLTKISGRPAASSSARDYLRRFPGGAYEKTARAIVEDE